MNACRIANSLWRLRAVPSVRRFERGLRIPRVAQRATLRRALAANASSAYGTAHGFAGIDDLGEYQRRVPIVTYDDLVPWIDRIRRGEPHVLTTEPVTHLIPTSGSSAARKLIPFTRGLQREFDAAIGPWISDLFRRRPDLMRGPAYWSVSPAIDDAPPEPEEIPIGFADDTAYLGGWARRLVASTLAVPSDVRRVTDPDAFRTVTLRFLLGAGDLRLASVWHPSFWTLLLDALPPRWDALLADIAHGTCRAAPALSPSLRSAFERRLAPDPARAAALRDADPGCPSTLWPHLGLISVWGDAAASIPGDALRERWPDVPVQAKGLVATEGVTSIPIGDEHPAAVTTHVIELLDDDGRAHELADAEIGGIYETILTTAGGLYRYRTGDRVRIEGRRHATPTLRFLGRANDVSDVAGEKLHADHVVTVVREACAACAIRPDFVLLAPERAAAPTRYVLFIASTPPPPPALARALDDGLSANPHYLHCRRLGQLDPPEVRVVSADAPGRVLEHDRAQGRRLGDIKPRVLRPEATWGECFAMDPATTPDAPGSVAYTATPPGV